MSRIHILLNKFALGTCSRAEFDELFNLLQKTGKDDDLQRYMRGLYDSLDTELISDTSINGQGDIVQEELTVVYKAKPGNWKKWAMAASVVICIGLTGWALYRSSFHGASDKRQMSRIYTPSGSKTSVVLPDGSTVWLNSNSTLTYTTGFVDGVREVSLIGEAMFDVKHDSLHPFLVHTDNFDVKDLGTVFNIQAYPEDKRAEASLISGSIEIAFRQKHTKKIVLVPNQRIIIQNTQQASINNVRAIRPNQSIIIQNAQQLAIKSIKADQPVIRPIIPDPQTREVPDTAWMVNKLIFSEEAFSDLAMKMQRRYNVTIIFDNEKLSQYKFTGRFEEETVDEALQELQLIAPFTYKKEQNRVYISK